MDDALLMAHPQREARTFEIVTIVTGGGRGKSFCGLPLPPSPTTALRQAVGGQLSVYPQAAVKAHCLRKGNDMTPVIVDTGRGRYAFCVHDYPGEILSAGGLYLYLRKLGNGHWEVLYAGQTASLDRRLLRDPHLDDGHAKAIALGATHVATFPGTWNEADRRRLEDDLIKFFCPPANHTPDPLEALIKALTRH